MAACWIKNFFLVIITTNIRESCGLDTDSAFDHESPFGQESEHGVDDWESHRPSKLIVDGERMKLIDDMILPLDFEPSNSATQSGIVNETRRWPNATVVYEISNEFDAREKAEIFKGMNKISRVTCLTFRQKRPGEIAFVAIRKTDDENQPGFCSSQVGRTGKRQLLILESPGCMQSGIVAHEFVHAVGFYHEQSRPDRDDFVVINWANIPKKYWENFEKYDKQTVGTFGVPYDFSSLMHYERSAFAIDKSMPSIQRKDCPTCDLAQYENLTPFDALKIQRMYKCPE